MQGLGVWRGHTCETPNPEASTTEAKNPLNPKALQGSLMNRRHSRKKVDDQGLVGSGFQVLLGSRV